MKILFFTFFLTVLYFGLDFVFPNQHSMTNYLLMLILAELMCQGVVDKANKNDQK